MEENKVVETVVETVNNTNGQIKVVVISAVGTLALAGLVTLGVKKGKKLIANHKAKKSKVVEATATEVTE